MPPTPRQQLPEVSVGCRDLGPVQVDMPCRPALLFLFILLAPGRAEPPCNDESCMNTMEIIRMHGYPAEEHEVTTVDGYMLTMHRIPYGRASNETAPRPLVFLQHCILCSSAVFVISGPAKGLGFILADKGYDVWMGNARGSIYSRKHRSMSLSDPTYWEFSWHEMGVYDLPAELGYAMRNTGQKRFHYIGHSMGTTMMYALLSVLPEYNTRVRLFISLSPVAYMTNIKSAVFRILYGPLGNALRKMGFQEFIPNSEIFTKLNRRLCKLHATIGVLCSNALFLIAGYDSQQLNKTMVPVIFGHIPAGTSTMSLVHYGQSMHAVQSEVNLNCDQMMIPGDFRQFDHGPDLNLQLYKSLYPPRYQAERITAPCIFFQGDNDWLSHPRDVERLRRRLPNLVASFRVPHATFNHMDFLFASDVVRLLYNQLLKQMAKF